MEQDFTNGVGLLRSSGNALFFSSVNMLFWNPGFFPFQKKLFPNAEDKHRKKHLLPPFLPTFCRFFLLFHFTFPYLSRCEEEASQIANKMSIRERENLLDEEEMKSKMASFWRRIENRIAFKHALLRFPQRILFYLKYSIR